VGFFGVFLSWNGDVVVGQATASPFEDRKKIVDKSCSLIYNTATMNKLKLFLALFLLVAGVAMLSYSRPVFAAVHCESQYGGGETCVRTGQLLVNKKVWDVDSKSFVDNLTLSNHRFQVGDEVTFTVEIKNVGDTTLTNVSFVDTLPSFLAWSGADGLTSTIASLNPGQSATLTIKAKVVDFGLVSTICNVNTAVATASDGSKDSDTAQVCAENKVKGVTTIPSTGPEQAVLVLLPAIGAVGYFLRQKKIC